MIQIKISLLILSSLTIISCKGKESIDEARFRTVYLKKIFQISNDADVDLSFRIDTNFKELDKRDPFNYALMNGGFVKNFVHRKDTISIFVYLTSPCQKSPPEVAFYHINGILKVDSTHIWNKENLRLQEEGNINQDSIVGRYTCFEHSKGIFFNTIFMKYSSLNNSNYCNGVRAAFRGSNFTVKDFKYFVSSIKLNR